MKRVKPPLITGILGATEVIEDNKVVMVETETRNSATENLKLLSFFFEYVAIAALMTTILIIGLNVVIGVFGKFLPGSDIVLTGVAGGAILAFCIGFFAIANAIGQVNWMATVSQDNVGDGIKDTEKNLAATGSALFLADLFA